jgi:geranyl-CoA carboxylase beta subunit
MPVIESQLDPHSEQFARHRAAMLDAVEQVRTLEQNLLDKAAEARPKFEKRGQLLSNWRASRATNCTTTRTAVRPAAA